MRMPGSMGAMAAAVLLGGCATVPGGEAGASGPDAGRPVAIEAETIRYETSPCFGTCPVYTVTVQPDGRGTFEGKRFTAVTGLRDFTATPDQYRRFKAALQPYRPAEGEKLYHMGTPLCGGPMVSDMPSIDVTWSELSGGSQHVSLYLGCGSQAMREAFRRAPDLLPIAKLVKPDVPFPPGR